MKAIIDLGTNTFHLLIATVTPQGIHELFQEQLPVKIGAGGIQQGLITDAAIQRGLSALQKFKSIIDDYGITEVKATGTSAIRNARNGGYFLEEIKRRFGFVVNFISGEREAELIYRGVEASFPFPDEPLMVMDIGGGSVEFIIGHKSEILWKQSFEIGAARLLEKFKPSDPLKPEEEKAIDEWLSIQLQPLKAAILKHQPKIMVGSAGSFETLLDMIRLDLGLSYPSVTPFAHEPSATDIDTFIRLVLKSAEAERRMFKGLVEFRVDMIVVATLLLRHVYQGFGFRRLIASNYALKEGLLLTDTAVG